MSGGWYMGKSLSLALNLAVSLKLSYGKKKSLLKNEQRQSAAAAAAAGAALWGGGLASRGALRGHPLQGGSWPPPSPGAFRSLQRGSPGGARACAPGSLAGRAGSRSSCCPLASADSARARGSVHLLSEGFTADNKESSRFFLP